MGITALKCPGCGANVEFDSDRDYGFCEYCGTKVMQEKIVVEHRVDETEKYGNIIRLANQAYAAGNYSEAYDYYTKSLEIKQDNYMVFFRKALCAGHLSSAGERNAEVISGIKSAYTLAGKEKEKELAGEITAFVSRKSLSAPSEFIGMESCNKYVEMIRGHVTLADALYLYVDNENPDIVGQYCRNIITACDMLQQTYTYSKINEGKKSNINVNLSLSGLSVNSNSGNDAPQIFHTPQAILSEVAAIRRKYVDESNKFTASKLSRQEARIEEAKKDVASIQPKLKLLHYVFCFPAVVAALVIALFVPVLGVIMLAAQVACYVIYLKMDEDKSAQEAYSELRELKEEYAALKKEMNR